MKTKENYTFSNNKNQTESIKPTLETKNQIELKPKSRHIHNIT